MLKERLAMTPKRLVFLVLGMVFATFLVQNAEVVQVRFFFWATEASRSLVLLVTFFLGLIVGWLSGRVRKKGRPATANSRK
jgi:putative membrane protein